jgi:hypothetical protein
VARGLGCGAEAPSSQHAQYKRHRHCVRSATASGELAHQQHAPESRMAAAPQ